MSDITIKKGSVTITCAKSDLMEVAETHDGVSFTLKGNLQLYITDPYMPQTMKQSIKVTADTYGDKKLIFDLDNQRRPVVIDATK